jgi:hypothetical protein
MTVKPLSEGEYIEFHVPHGYAADVERLKELFAELKTRARLTEYSDDSCVNAIRWDDVEELFEPLVRK